MLVCIAMGSVVLWFSELRKLLTRSLRHTPVRGADASFSDVSYRRSSPTGRTKDRIEL